MAWTVSQVAVPPAARALSTLFPIHYEDGFLVDTGPARDRTGEQWARLFLEDARPVTRRALVSGWSALGLQLGSTRSDEYVLGWELRRNTPDVALLGADSRLGLRGEVLFMRRMNTLLFATFVEHRNPMSRSVWAGVAPVHRQVVRNLLGRPSQAESTPSM